jgi:2-polyprenyl-3-methyl-5-hydroxy-6-metoxy-1,4-benzoquinol methylase
MDKLLICPLCKSENNSIFKRVNSFGCPLVYYQCKQCLLVFQSANDCLASDPAFYEQTYRLIYQSNEAPTPKDLLIQELRAIHLQQFLKKFGLDRVTRVLDVGASTGELLRAIAEKYNAQPLGVEPSRVYRQYAQAKGVPMFATLDELINAAPERFDLITLIHVLEHLVDPLETLITLRQKLITDNGCLLIEVPNFYAHDSYELAHLTCFTSHHLREMLQAAGLQIIQEKKHGLPRSKILNLYITMLAKPSVENIQTRPIKVDRFVTAKRQAGMAYRKVLEKALPDLAWLPIEPTNYLFPVFPVE